MIASLVRLYSLDARQERNRQSQYRSNPEKRRCAISGWAESHTGSGRDDDQLRYGRSVRLSAGRRTSAHALISVENVGGITRIRLNICADGGVLGSAGHARTMSRSALIRRFVSSGLRPREMKCRGATNWPIASFSGGGAQGSLRRESALNHIKPRARSMAWRHGAIRGHASAMPADASTTT